MKILFKKRLYFLMVFLVLLFLDIYVKLEVQIPLLRVVTKVLVIGSLMLYYSINHKEREPKNSKYTSVALLFFMLGDITFVFDSMPLFFMISILFFVVGKGFYCMRFKNYEIFEISKILPFLLLSFVFMIWFLFVIYPKLDYYFIPILIYLFVALLLFLFAFLRKQAVSKSSYLIVLFGVFSFGLSETLTALKMFSSGFLFDDFLIMFCYGVAQYLIVLGLLSEDRAQRIPPIGLS